MTPAPESVSLGRYGHIQVCPAALTTVTRQPDGSTVQGEPLYEQANVRVHLAGEDGFYAFPLTPAAARALAAAVGRVCPDADEGEPAGPEPRRWDYPVGGPGCPGCAAGRGNGTLPSREALLVLEGIREAAAVLGTTITVLPLPRSDGDPATPGCQPGRVADAVIGPSLAAERLACGEPG